jgi:hypothetical protein
MGELVYNLFAPDSPKGFHDRSLYVSVSVIERRKETRPRPVGTDKSENLYQKLAATRICPPERDNQEVNR